jgi:ABC-2 type transport system permease protein
MKTFVTLLKREFWENRGGFLWAPFIVVGLFVIAILIGLLFAERHVDGGNFTIQNIPFAQMVNGLKPEQMEDVAKGVNMGLAGMAVGVQLVLAIVLFFYLISSLYDDRRDRSILFWKSMPVSDVQTIGSKIFSAAIVAPIIAWFAAIAFHIIAMLLIGGWLSLHGVAVFKLFGSPGVTESIQPVRLWLCMLVALPVNALWALPSYGWLMLVSSWARSKPFIWAVSVPLVSGALLSMVDLFIKLRVPEQWMWLHVIPRAMFSILPFSWSPNGKGFGYDFDKSPPTEMLSFASIGDVLTSANLWIGVAAGVALIAGAVYMRRYREVAD